MIFSPSKCPILKKICLNIYFSIGKLLDLNLEPELWLEGWNWMLCIQSSKCRQIWPRVDLLIPERLEQLQGKRKIRINEKKSHNVLRLNCNLLRKTRVITKVSKNAA